MGIRRRRRRPGAQEAPADEPAAEGERAPEGAGEPSPEGEQPTGLISGTRSALKPIKKRHVIVASMGIMGIGFAGLLLFSAFSLWWTSTPEFCDKCHVMNVYVDTWEASPHGEENCEHCHLNPGLFSFMGGKIASMQVVANFMTGNFEDDSFTAHVSNAACLQCHEDLMEEEVTTYESGITVSHLHIIDNGAKCMDCHSTVAHGDSVEVGAVTLPTMDKCMKCHDGKTAPTDCVLCHREGPPAEDAIEFDEFGVVSERADVQEGQQGEEGAP